MADTAAKVSRCESIIGHTFANKALTLEALYTFPATIFLHGGLFAVPKNGSLAVLGDSTLRHVLCQKWYATGRSKEQWTTILTDVTTNVNLNTVGRAAGLDACVFLNPGNPTVSPKPMSTVVEAVIGAVYRDAGENAAAGVLQRLGLLRHEFLGQTAAAGT